MATNSKHTCGKGPINSFLEMIKASHFFVCIVSLFHSHHRHYRGSASRGYDGARMRLLLQSFRYAATQVWNMLPDDIRTSESLIAFKRAFQNITA